MPGALSQYLLSLAVIALPLSMIATTVAATRVFRGFRRCVCARSPWLGDMVACPYCVGVWLTMPTTAGLLFCASPALTWNWGEYALAGVVLWGSLSLVGGVLSGCLCWALSRMDELHGGGA